MASGTESLMNALLRAAGFNPREFAEGINNFVGGVNGKLQEFDTRLNGVEQFLVVINQKLDLLLTDHANASRDENQATLSFGDAHGSRAGSNGGGLHKLE